jgi:hypothetical protein
MVVVDVWCRHVSALADYWWRKTPSTRTGLACSHLGGRSAFLRLVSQPQNECTAAGGQCAIPIWGIHRANAVPPCGHPVCRVRAPTAGRQHNRRPGALVGLNLKRISSKNHSLRTSRTTLSERAIPSSGSRLANLLSHQLSQPHRLPAKASQVSCCRVYADGGPKGTSLSQAPPRHRRPGEVLRMTSPEIKSGQRLDVC